LRYRYEINETHAPPKISATVKPTALSMVSVWPSFSWPANSANGVPIAENQRTACNMRIASSLMLLIWHWLLLGARHNFFGNFALTHYPNFENRSGIDPCQSPGASSDGPESDMDSGERLPVAYSPNERFLRNRHEIGWRLSRREGAGRRRASRR
jgi:hypothetical protein